MVFHKLQHLLRMVAIRMVSGLIYTTSPTSQSTPSLQATIRRHAHAQLIVYWAWTAIAILKTNIANICRAIFAIGPRLSVGQEAG